MIKKEKPVAKEKLNLIHVEEATYERLCKRFDKYSNICKFVNKSVNKILNRLDRLEQEEKDKNGVVAQPTVEK